MRAANSTRIAVEIVREYPNQIGFRHPWIGRNRRLGKDFEASIASAELSSTPVTSPVPRQRTEHHIIAPAWLVDVKQVGRELGVRYVLEGSVRKAARRARITGKLVMP